MVLLSNLKKSPAANALRPFALEKNTQDAP